MRDNIKSFSILMKAVLLLILFIFLYAGKQDRRSAYGGLTDIAGKPVLTVYSENFLDGPVFEVAEIEP